MFIRISMYVCIPTCVCMHVHVRVRVLVHARVRVHVRLRVHVRVYRAKTSRPGCPHGWAKMLAVLQCRVCWAPIGGPRC